MKWEVRRDIENKKRETEEEVVRVRRKKGKKIIYHQSLSTTLV